MPLPPGHSLSGSRIFFAAGGGGGGGGGTGVPTFLSNLPGGVEAALYQGQLVVSGSFPMTFEVTAGTLPTGTTLNATTGLITGTASVGGNYTFTITATNTYGSTSQEYTVAITGVAPYFAISQSFSYGAINNPLFTPDGVTTLPYSDLGPYGLNYPAGYVGTEPITWTISGEPDGITLNTATGFLIGYPNNPAQVPGPFTIFTILLRGTNAWGTYLNTIEMQILPDGTPIPP